MSDNTVAHRRIKAVRNIATKYALKTQFWQYEFQCVVFLGALLSVFFHLLFADYFFNVRGIGHDYSYFLPALLDGVYRFKNHGFRPYLFSPAFCGGLPVMANPQSMVYSTPQLLSYLTNPLNAVYLTFLIFAQLGYLGFYLLLRFSFRCQGLCNGLARRRAVHVQRLFY